VSSRAKEEIIWRFAWPFARACDYFRSWSFSTKKPRCTFYGAVTLGGAAIESSQKRYRAFASLPSRGGGERDPGGRKNKSGTHNLFERVALLPFGHDDIGDNEFALRFRASLHPSILIGIFFRRFPSKAGWRGASNRTFRMMYMGAWPNPLWSSGVIKITIVIIIIIHCAARVTQRCVKARNYGISR